MTIQSLLQESFEAGKDSVNHPSIGYFQEWMEENTENLQLAILNSKYLHICISKVNGNKRIAITEDEKWPFSPFIYESAVNTFVTWEIINLKNI